MLGFGLPVGLIRVGFGACLLGVGVVFGFYFGLFLF